MSDTNDVKVYAHDGIPRVYPDAYAVRLRGGFLEIRPWSTRFSLKTHALAEYVPGAWLSYDHTGEQGHEEQPKPPEPEHLPELPAPAEPDARLREAMDRFGKPDPVDPTDPQHLRPATVRPALPPRGVAPVPTSRLPHRGTADDETQTIPRVPADAGSAVPGRRRAAAGSAGRLARKMWPAAAFVAFSFLAALR
jgi:hypothetical protein